MLPSLGVSVYNSLVSPVIWVIVDGGSKDSTVKIIKTLEQKNAFTKGLFINDEVVLPIERYGFTVRTGLEYAKAICKKNGWTYDYLCLVDVDVVFPKDYFNNLFKEFTKDPKLGLASGAFNVTPDKSQPVNEAEEPKGPILVFRKECYADIGGFPAVASPDTVSILKVKNRGWHVREFGYIKAVHRREFASRKGLWKGYFTSGKTNYYLNYHPVNALLTGFFYTIFKRPRYIGFAYLLGYSKSMFSRDKKIKDPEVTNYFWTSLSRLFRRVLLKESDR